MTAFESAPGPQHLCALARANEVRLARAELKRRVHDGDVSAAEVVLDAPWEAERMTVANLLMSQRRWGRTRCRKLLQGIPMSESKTIGTMTDRQRRAIATALERGQKPGRESASPPAERLAGAPAQAARDRSLRHD
ncbi:MAG: hypothetical protein M3417_02125 [Actinomycetota bacterium]|nr:hypothetical protein [Actinomycetota bacterium]